MAKFDDPVLQNQRVQFVDACCTQSVLIVLYLITFVRMFKESWLNFVAAISLLLMISCVSWIFMTYLVL